MRHHFLAGSAFGALLLAGMGFASAQNSTNPANQDPTQQNAGQAVMGQQADPTKPASKASTEVKGDLSVAKTPEDKKKAEQALEEAAAAAGGTNGASDGTRQPRDIDHNGTTPDELQRSEQAVPPEPTTHAAEQPALVGGKLAVPGAAPQAQTEPAKFSGKNDAIDKLDQNALTDKQLTAEQRRALHQRLGTGRETTGSGGDALAREGVQLPASVELRPLPEDVARDMPNIAMYKYVRAGDKVLLVEPSNRIVVAVLSE
jgi:Protein of unknown function (DUF1236)